MLKIYIIAGEASGDNIGAKLMAQLKSQCSDIEFYGIGGTKMQSLGLKSLFPIKELSLMGFFEILPHIFNLRKRIKQTVEHIISLDLDAVISIDSPGFSFKIIERIKGKTKAKLIHYVAPTVWAYKPKRAKKIAKLYDHLLTILPFEEPYFTKEALDTSFVGYPALENLPIISSDFFRYKFNIDQGSLIICLTPGSRSQEVKTLLPIFLSAAEIFINKNNHKAIVAISASAGVKHIIEEFKKYNNLKIIIVDEEDKHSLFSAANLAVSKSGTVTTELLFYHTPLIVAHKINFFSYLALKLMIKVKYVNILNILLNKELIPELLQGKCKAHIIAQELDKLNISVQTKWDNEVDYALEKLQNNHEKPSIVAAEKILSLIREP
jgi:lipid-A-disaccharide synthase